MVSPFNVYVPMNLEDRKDCWTYFQANSKKIILDNIIIARDLDITLGLDEKNGGSRVRDPIKEWVEELIQD